MSRLCDQSTILTQDSVGISSGLGRQRKPEDRALADPNYEGTAAADTALGPGFNCVEEKANRRPIPVSS